MSILVNISQDWLNILNIGKHWLNALNGGGDLFTCNPASCDLWGKSSLLYLTKCIEKIEKVHFGKQATLLIHDCLERNAFFVGGITIVCTHLES